MLRKKLLIITFALAGALISSPVLANNCDTASPQGVGCVSGTYYCSGSCRSGLSWCPTWSPSPTCASGLDCSNCSGADSCGVCNACNSGYRLCGAYPSNFCKADGTLPANCSSYNTNCDACTACVAGYTLNAGACVPATLKLGSSSVSGTSVVQGGADSSLFVAGNKVGIGISAPTANLQLNATTNTEGLRIITSNYSPFIIRNSSDTADLFRIDQDGNITSLGNMSGSNTYWNFSGSSLFASSTAWNVGIGTTNATDKLTVVGGINSNSVINGLSLCINGDCKTSWGDAGWSFDGNTVGQTKSFGTLDDYSIPFLTNGSERMRLTNAGNLVIGTSTTGVRLHVESPQGAVAFFKSKINGGSYAGYIGNGQTFSGEEFGLYYADGVYDNRLAVYNLNNSLFLYGGHLSTDAPLAINNNTGFVGIGMTNPGYKLDVNGSIRIPNAAPLMINSAAGTATAALQYDSGDNFIFNTPSGGDIYLRSNGNTIVRVVNNGDVNLGGISATTNPAVKILTSGNVGIGTTNPGAKLEVVGSVLLPAAATIQFGTVWNTGTLDFKNGATTAVRIDVPNNRVVNNLGKYLTQSSSVSQFGTLDNYATTLITNNTERVRIDTAGNVGIGTTNPGAKLEVAGTFRVNGSLNSVVLDRLSGTGNRIVMADASGSLYATSSAAASGLPTGTTGQTLRHDGTNWLANSVIYNNGTNVGIGVSPSYKLDVNGSFRASGTANIETASDQILNLRQLGMGGTAGVKDPGWNYIGFLDSESDRQGYFGIDSSGNMLFNPEISGATVRTNSSFVVGSGNLSISNGTFTQSGAVNSSFAGNLGIGTTNPGAYRLNVVGASNLGGNLTATGTVSFTGVVFAGGGNRMITVDNAGVLGAGALPVSLPTGTTSYTLRYDGSNWVSNGNIFNNGTNVGIGTTTPGTYRLSVDGTTRLNGAVTTSLSGTGNRCVYVDATGNLLAKGVDCGTATGGDEMGAHSATQNIRLNSYWLSGDGGNEGLFVNGTGRVGIGNSSPGYPLDVSGIIKTDNRIMIETGNGTIAMFMADEYGVSEAGLYSGSGYRVATYHDYDNVFQYADGAIYASVGNIGIGTTNPGAYRLNVSGTTNLGGNLTATGAVSLTGPIYAGGGNRMITVDNAGVLGAAAMPASLPSGTTSYTLRYNGSSWVSNANIYNNGTNVGVGTTTPAQKFSVGNTASDYIQSYGGFIGHPNANIGGTGDAAFFPEGIYSAKMNWLYGGINMNNGNLSGAGSGTFSGNVGIGTTNIATYRLNVIGTSNLGGNLTATGTVSFTGVVFAGGGNRMITVDNAGVLGAAAIPASLPSGTTSYTLRYDGSNWVSNSNIFNNGTNVGVGTTNPGAKLHVVGNAIISSSLTMGGDVNMGSNNITNLNKLTVNTIDPLYNIQGVNYSTFASAIVGGVKEEYVGTIKVIRAVAGGGEEYEAVVNFDAVAKGSDLWVWRQIVDFSPENVQVNITPYGSFASAYYQIKGNKLIFRSDRPAELSYRLVGKRLDWRQWPTKALDQQEKAGFQID